MVSSTEVKAVVKEAGADLVGIASVDRFAGAPPMRRPTDLLPGTRSVIVAAVRYPLEGVRRIGEPPGYALPSIDYAGAICRKLEDIARGAVKFGLADAVCLAGTTAGSEIAENDLRAARRGAGDAPVIAGTGVSVENAERMLSLADGVIMGTSIKFGRDTFRPVDPEKAAEFIRRAKDIRDRLQ